MHSDRSGLAPLRQRLSQVFNFQSDPKAGVGLFPSGFVVVIVVFINGINKNESFVCLIDAAQNLFAKVKLAPAEPVFGFARGCDSPQSGWTRLTPP